MPRVPLDPVARETSSPATDRLAALAELFPEVACEGRIDVDKLRALLGAAVDDRPERYTFSWAGKRDAIRILAEPSRAALVPDRAQSLDFDDTGNVFIEGDNLEVLKLLYKSYFGRVKMIYIDPPYNTGNDFVYADNFRDPLDTYLKLTGQRDSDGNLLTSNTDASGRYHSAWLSMMYPRLVLARQLLRDDGVIFVSIDDHEVHNLRLIMNEIFGEENFVATLIWQKMDSPSRNDPDRPVTDYHEYVLVYARDKQERGLRQKAKPGILAAYPIEFKGRPARLRQLRKNGKDARREDRPSMWYSITAPDGSELWPIAPEGWEGRWVLSRETWQERVAAGLYKWVKREYGWVPYYIELGPEEPSVPWPTLWTEVSQNRQAKAEFTDLLGSSVEFSNPKPSDLIVDMLHMASGLDGVVLDFFAGSATTAHAVLKLNRADGGDRRFIMVQLPEPLAKPVALEGSGELRTIADIGKERIRRVVARLKDARKDELGIPERETPEDLGFRVYRLAESALRPWTGAEGQGSMLAASPGARDAEPVPGGFAVSGTPEAAPTPAPAIQPALFTDPLRDGWTPEGVIAEIALREGYSLSFSATPVAGLPPGVTVHRVHDPARDQHFLICLDERVVLATLDGLSLERNDLFVCRDSALDDDTAANLALQCRLKVI